MRFGGLIVAFDGDAVSLELLQRMGTVDLLSNWRTAAPAERRRWKVAAGADELELSSSELTRFGGSFTLLDKLVRDRRFTRQYAVYLNPLAGEELNHLQLAAHRLAEAGLAAETLVLEEDYSSLNPQEALDTVLAAEVTAKLEQLSSGLEVLLMDDWAALGGSVEGLAVAALLVGRYAAQHGCSVFVAAAPDGDPGAWAVVISQMLQAIAREEEVQDASDAGTSEDAVNAHGDS